MQTARQSLEYLQISGKASSCFASPGSRLSANRQANSPKGLHLARKHDIGNLASGTASGGLAKLEASPYSSEASGRSL